MNCRKNCAVIAALMLEASVAFGDEPRASSSSEIRPSRAAEALEIAIAVGSGQAYGYLGGDLPGLNDMGWAFDVAAGWRIDRNWLVGAYGSGGVYDSLGARNYSYNAAAGLQVNRHFPQPEGYDVWVGLGFGWHGYWASDVGERDSHQGLELARLQLGFESRLSPSFTLSPMLGAALTTFLWQRSASGAEYANVQDRRLSASLFAGLLARFELFGGGR